MDLRNTTLSSTRLRMKAFEPDDAADVYAAVTPGVTRFMRIDPSPSLDAFCDVWSAWIPAMASGTDLFLVVRLALTGEFLGVAGLHGIGDQEAEAGIWIKEASHGFGYGREAVSTLVGWAAGATGVQRIIYPVVEYNYPSRRVAESLHGEITERRRLKKTDGLDHPIVVYRIPVPRAG